MGGEYFMKNGSYFEKREKCPVCGTPKEKILYSCEFAESPIREFLESFYLGRVQFDYLEGARFELCECSNCGLIWQRQIPNDFLTGKLYEEWISPEQESALHKEDNDLFRFSHYASEIVSMILYSGSVPRRIDVLDFGMGWGEWCSMAKAFGCNAYGTEISREKIDCAKANGIIAIDYQEIERHRFDLINVEQVLEHIPSPMHTLKYLSNSLKPDGLIKLSVPNETKIRRKLRIEDWMAPRDSRNSLNAVSPLEHINCFTRSTMVRMAELADLKKVGFPFLQISASAPWDTPGRILKNFLRPFYLDLFCAYAFFKKKPL